MHLSIWEKESFFAPADIIIAGSGFTGLWTAYYLKKKSPDLRITIVERGVVPTGASTRNAGFACFGSVTELMSDVTTMGEDKMLALTEMRYAGLARIRKVFHKKEIGFEQCGGFELIDTVHPARHRELGEQIHWLNRRLREITGRPKVFSFADNKISRFGFSGVAHLIETKHEGALHSGKLCQKLLQKVQGMGVTLLTNTEIRSYEAGDDGVTLLTDKHFQLSGKKLIVCTNAFAKQLLPELDITPARGQVLVTAPVPGLSIRGTFHFDEGYYYFRNLEDRLLLGGARNAFRDQEGTTHADITDNVQQALETFIKERLLPHTPVTITDRWSGIMGMGPEKMPIVKKVSANIYCAVRMSGMGVALAPEIGRQLARMLV